MKKRSLLIMGAALLITLSIVGGYFGLKAIPPRYQTRLPEPLRQIAAPRTQAPILPTAVIQFDTQALLADTDTTNVETAEPTATPLPALVVTQTTTDSPTQTPQPTPTTTPTPVPTPTPTPIPAPPSVRLNGIQHQFQSWNNCGPATLAMTLSYFGLNLSQEQTAAVLKPNPEDRNVSPWEMVDYVNQHTPYKAIFRVNGRIDTIRRLLSQGIPVIVEIGIDPPGEFRWMGWYGHYLLIVAYDDAAQQFWVYDSWFGTSEEPLTNANPDGRILTYADVQTYWPHFNRNYIALYRPEQAQTVADIIGADMDDATMWQNALRKAQQDAASDPENAFYWFNLGTAYNAHQEYEKAAQAFDQARAIGLPWRMMWYQFGPYEAYYQTGRYEDVILLADVTLQDRPYFEESFYYKGLAMEALGSHQEAVELIQKAAELNPNYRPAQETLSQLENGGSG
jgi:multisubunit Na+/H+ antiporter MnhC subunit